MQDLLNFISPNKGQSKSDAHQLSQAWQKRVSDIRVESFQKNLDTVASSLDRTHDQHHPKIQPQEPQNERPEHSSQSHVTRRDNRGEQNHYERHEASRLVHDDHQRPEPIDRSSAHEVSQNDKVKPESGVEDIKLTQDSANNKDVISSANQNETPEVAVRPVINEEQIHSEIIGQSIADIPVSNAMTTTQVLAEANRMVAGSELVGEVSLNQDQIVQSIEELSEVTSDLTLNEPVLSVDDATVLTMAGTHISGQVAQQADPRSSALNVADDLLNTGPKNGIVETELMKAQAQAMNQGKVDGQIQSSFSSATQQSLGAEDGSDILNQMTGEADAEITGLKLAEGSISKGAQKSELHSLIHKEPSNMIVMGGLSSQAASKMTSVSMDPMQNFDGSLEGVQSQRQASVMRDLQSTQIGRQIPMERVGLEISRQIQAGNTRFQIRLDPPELGRVDVRLEIDGDGKMMARMVVERSETLDMFLRDARQLEKALQQAGLDTKNTQLEFKLKQDGQDQGFAQNQGGAEREEHENAEQQVAGPLDHDQLYMELDESLAQDLAESLYQGTGLQAKGVDFNV